MVVSANPVVPSTIGVGFTHGQWVRSSASGISAATIQNMTHTHVGLDLQAAEGSLIRSFASGIVTKVISRPADCHPRVVPQPEWCYLGYMVMIKHSTGLVRPFYTLYLHMAAPPLVNRDDKVHTGDSIGLVGQTGAANGPHTHFEIRYFPTVIYPPWGNIYGPGDQKESDAFLNEWLDPQKAFIRYPQGLSDQASHIAEDRPGNTSSMQTSNIVPDPELLADQIGIFFRLAGTLLIVLSGFALMLSTFMSKRVAGNLFFSGVICVVISSLLSSMGSALVTSTLDFIGSLPLSVIIIAGGLLIISALQAFVALFLGWKAANSFAGNLAASLFKSIFIIILAPLRLLKRLLGNSD